MFSSLRRALVGLAIIAASTVAVPVAVHTIQASDGTLDNTTWGPENGGRVLVNWELNEPIGMVRFTATAGYLMSDPSGALLLAGYVGSAAAGDQKFASLVLDSSGSPLNTFNGNGLTVYDLPNFGATQYAQGAAEKIFKVANDYVLAGWVGPDEGNGQPAMLRVNGSNMARNGSDWAIGFNPGWVIVTDGRKLQGGGSGVGSSIPGASFSFNASTGYVMSTDTTTSSLTRVSRYNLLTGAEETVGMGSGSKTFDTAQVLGANRAVSSFSQAFTGGLGVQLLVVTKPTTAPSSNDRAELVGLDASGPAPVRAANYNGGAVMATNINANHLASIVSLDNNSFLLAGSDGFDSNIVKVSKSTVALGTTVSIPDLDMSKGGMEVSIMGQPLLVGQAGGLTIVVRRSANDLSADSTFNPGTEAGQVVGERRITAACSSSSYKSTIVPGLGARFWVMQSRWGAQSTEYGASVLKFDNSGMSSTACPVIPPLSVVGTFSINGTTGTTASMNTPMPSGFIRNYTTYTYSVSMGTTTPCGLSLNTSNGKFEGSITSTGNGSVTVRVTNNAPNPQAGTYTVSYNCTAAPGGGGGGGGMTCSSGASTILGTSPGVDTAFGGGWQTVAPQGATRFAVAGFHPTSDNKLLLMSGLTTASGGQIDLRKFELNGSADTGFGTQGVLTFDPSTNTEAEVELRHASRGPSGDFAVMGRYKVGQLYTYFVLKLTSTGTVDTTFNPAGAVPGVLELSNTPELLSVAVLSDGSVLVRRNNAGTPTLERFTAVGVADNSFGGSGTLAVVGTVARLAPAANGAFFVVKAVSGDIRVSKYTVAGSLDAWATQGEKTFGDPNTSESARAIKVLGSDLFVAYTASGPVVNGVPMQTWNLSKIDLSDNQGNFASFGSGGTATSSAMPAMVSDIIELSDGALVLSGYKYDNYGPTAGIIRISSAGVIDSAFSSSPATFLNGACSMIVDGASPSTGNFVGGYVPVANGQFVIAASKWTDLGTTPVVAIAMARLDFGIPNAQGGGGGGGGGNNNVVVPVAPPTTVPSDPDDDGDEVPTDPGRPSLVTDENRPGLVRAPGQGGVVVDGEVVEVVTEVVDVPAAQVRPERRTPAQVNQIRQAANELVQQFTQQLPPGVETTVQVVATSTGAIIRGLVTDANGNPIDVPAEDVVLMRAEDLVVMVGAQSANVTSDGRFQVPVGSTFGLAGTGFGGEEEGEFVVMSTPTLIAEFETTEVGTFDQTGTLPQSIPVGDHTLVVATGTTYAVLGIQVVPTTLPVTGSSNDVIVVFALFTVVFGALLVRSRRTLLIG